MQPRPAQRPITLRPRRRVLTDLARIFSTVLNPFLTAFALFVILAHAFSKTTQQFWFLLFVSTFFTSVGPMLYVLWLYAGNRITDLDMSVRSEREAVFGAFVVFYLAGGIVLALVHAPTLLVATMAGYTTASLVTGVITRYWKISTHALGITAPLVVMIYIYHLQPLPFLVLIPLVGWARLYLKAHTLGQVIAGVALGGGSVVLFFRLFHLL